MLAAVTTMTAAAQGYETPMPVQRPAAQAQKARPQQRGTVTTPPQFPQQDTDLPQQMYDYQDPIVTTPPIGTTIPNESTIPVPGTPVVSNTPADGQPVYGQHPDTVFVPVYVNADGGNIVNVVQTGSSSPHKTHIESVYEKSLKRRGIERVNRDELKKVFVPKGMWMVGGDISFNEWDTRNSNLLVLKNLDVKGHTFGASPYFGYFVKNNFAVGGRFSYDRYYFKCDNLDLNLGEDLKISLDHLYFLEHTFKGCVFMRNYVPIAGSRVFGIFNETRLSYGYSKGKNTTGTGEAFDGTMTRSHSIQLGIVPGITAFLSNNAAAEISVGVLGFSYNWTDEVTNQVETGSSRSGSGNFKINLFSINIGMVIYL